jgi:hypothetical protein
MLLAFAARLMLAPIELPLSIVTTDLVARVFGVCLHNWTDPNTGHTHLSFDRLVKQDDAAAAQTQATSSGELACET